MSPISYIYLKFNAILDWDWVFMMHVNTMCSQAGFTHIVTLVFQVIELYINMFFELKFAHVSPS